MESQDERIISLNALEIQSILGVTYPMLLLDKVIELEPGKYCRAQKNVSFNEWFFPAHHPAEPIMPGMLQIEALTQALALTVLYTDKFRSNGRVPVLLAGVDKCRFYKAVVPGDILNIHVEIGRFVLGVVMGSAYAEVNGVVVCECKCTAKVQDHTQGGL